jgi:Kef-type K+ transport system membrane component KefB
VTIATLALIVGVALAGPLLSWSDRLRIPVVVGELAAGVVIGRTGFRLVDATTSTFVFLADIGFAMIMFVAGSHVPIRDRALRAGSTIVLLRLVLVGVAAALLGPLVAALFGTGHAALYAVLFGSSSAAIIFPVRDSLKLQGPPVLALLPQVAVADVACIVALPLAIVPAHAGRAAAEAAAVLAAALVFFALLWQSERRGWRRALHRKSERRRFALELRISLLILLVLAAFAQRVHVTIMLAGFCFGLAVAAVGEPRRLTRQLFALTEGLFGPVFFVWLGASLDLRELRQHPSMIALGVTLAAAAVLAHAVTILTRQPPSLAALATAQLGVPVAAATLGQQLHLLRPGEPAALLLGALLTVAIATGAGRVAASRFSAPPSPATAPHNP